MQRSTSGCKESAPGSPCRCHGRSGSSQRSHRAQSCARRRSRRAEASPPGPSTTRPPRCPAPRTPSAAARVLADSAAPSSRTRGACKHHHHYTALRHSSVQYRSTQVTTSWLGRHYLQMFLTGKYVYLD